MAVDADAYDGYHRGLVPAAGARQVAAHPFIHSRTAARPRWPPGLPSHRRRCLLSQRRLPRRRPDRGKDARCHRSSHMGEEKGRSRLLFYATNLRVSVIGYLRVTSRATLCIKRWRSHPRQCVDGFRQGDPRLFRRLHYEGLDTAKDSQPASTTAILA
jgi:hypothetical protein